MPNGDDPNKRYGGHKYAGHDGTSNCEHGCGCWMGPARSGGPPGLDPGGECSNNPEDGHRLGGNRDLAIIVERRIRDLASRAYTAEQKLKQVDPGVIKLAEELAETKRKLSDAQDRAQKAVVLLSQ